MTASATDGLVQWWLVAPSVDQFQTHSGLTTAQQAARVFAALLSQPEQHHRWVPLHPHGTTAACERSWSFCKKCRWQVTAKHACTLCMWLCMKWRTTAVTAAVSCGTSYASTVSTPLRWILKNVLWKARHSCRITCRHSESAWEQRIVLFKSNQQQGSACANPPVKGLHLSRIFTVEFKSFTCMNRSNFVCGLYWQGSCFSTVVSWRETKTWWVCFEIFTCKKNTAKLLKSPS